MQARYALRAYSIIFSGCGAAFRASVFAGKAGAAAQAWHRVWGRVLLR